MIFALCGEYAENHRQLPDYFSRIEDLLKEIEIKVHTFLITFHTKCDTYHTFEKLFEFKSKKS